MTSDLQSSHHGLIRRWRGNTTLVLGRQTTTMPGVLKAWLGGSWLRGLPRGCLILFLIIIVGGLLPDGVLRPSAQVSGLRRFIAALLLLISIGGVGFAFWHVGRIRRRVETYEFTLCLVCGYPLIGLARAGRCPECGASYEVENIRHEWEQWFGTV
jgi:hypothetical protein